MTYCSTDHVIKSTRPPPPTFVMKLLTSLPHPPLPHPLLLTPHHYITLTTTPSHTPLTDTHPYHTLPYPPTHILPHTLTACVPTHTSNTHPPHTCPHVSTHTLTRPHHSGVFLCCKVFIVQPPLQHLISLILLITVQWMLQLEPWLWNNRGLLCSYVWHHNDIIMMAILG